MSAELAESIMEGLTSTNVHMRALSAAALLDCIANDVDLTSLRQLLNNSSTQGENGEDAEEPNAYSDVKQ